MKKQDRKRLKGDGEQANEYDNGNKKEGDEDSKREKRRKQSLLCGLNSCIFQKLSPQEHGYLFMTEV
jgi:hypothetical protein